MRTFIDISSDKIGIYWLGEPIFLEKTDVDIKIGEKLVELDRKFGFDDILVLNGPWGFTNLRVWSLALNLLKTLKNDSINFCTISKPELYNLFYSRGLLPRYWILYIGQKSNVWLWDTEENKLVKMVKKAEIEDIKKEYGELYLDQVYDKAYFWENKDQIAYTFDNWKLILNWDKTFNREEIAVNNVDKIDANYMIEPNVS